MGRKAKLRRQRKQQQASIESEIADSTRDRGEESDMTSDSETDNADRPVPLSRRFIDRMERQGYSLKDDTRAPTIPTDARPKPQRR